MGLEQLWLLQFIYLVMFSNPFALECHVGVGNRKSSSSVFLHISPLRKFVTAADKQNYTSFVTQITL